MPRPLGRDDRGARRAVAPPHPRGVGLRRRGRPDARRALPPAVPRVARTRGATRRAPTSRTRPSSTSCSTSAPSACSSPRSSSSSPSRAPRRSSSPTPRRSTSSPESRRVQSRTSAAARWERGWQDVSTTRVAARHRDSPEPRRSNTSLLSSPGSSGFACARGSAPGRRGRAGSTLVAGPGVAHLKSRPSGCEAGHAGLSGRPRLPSRARVRSGVGDESRVERVADATLQRPDRFFLRLAFGEFALVVAVAGRMGMADLGDRGHVDRVVQLPVPSPRQSVGEPPTRGHLDRCGAVVRREPVASANRRTSRV